MDEQAGAVRVCVADLSETIGCFGWHYGAYDQPRLDSLGYLRGYRSSAVELQKTRHSVSHGQGISRKERSETTEIESATRLNYVEQPEIILEERNLAVIPPWRPVRIEYPPRASLVQ